VPSSSSVPWRCAVACSLVAGLGAVAGPGCDGAVTLTVAGDLPVPDGVDAICVAVADRAPAGGQFGRVYQLTGDLAGLPQTLAVSPGSASSAEAWVRGYRAGEEVARDRTVLDFGGDATLRLDRCRPGRAGTPSVAATDPGDATRIVPSLGRGGAVVVALGAAGGRVVDASGGGLAELGTLTPDGAVVDAVAFDADGDCDDDLVIATDAGPPHLWLRGQTDFTDAGAVAASAVRAVAAGDVDGDGDMDLVVGAGADLELLRNDGAGRFTVDPAAFGGGAQVSDVTALALGDIDGDGHADLVVGQGDAAAQPLRALLGDGAGFTVASGVLPAVSLRVARARLVDADGDGDLDAVLVLADEPPRLYVNRDGRLEDQSYVRLPQPAPIAAAVAIARWDDDCAPDLAVAATAATDLARGADTGAFTDEAQVPAAADAAFVDLDDDGAIDLVTAGPGGVAWVRR